MRVWQLGLGLGLGLGILSSAVVAGCGGGSSGSVDTGGGPSARPLDGRTFVSTSVTEGGEDRPLVGGTRIEIGVSDGQIRASAGCNMLGGQVDVTPDRIEVDGMGSTAMGCDAALHDQDAWLSGFLSGNPGYTLDGHILRLVRGETTIELVDREVADPDRPLEATTWGLDGIVDGDVASSVPAGAGATLTVTGGTATVAVDGCNQGSAEVTVTETAITVGGLMMTEMACPDPAATVEAAVVAVLDGEITYAIDGDALTLTHPSGQGLTFRAAD